MIARRESIESSSSEEIQFEKKHAEETAEKPAASKSNNDDRLHRREELDDPEQEFLLRLEERHGGSVDRHAILQWVIGDLRSYSELKLFLEFERKQTTAAKKLTNPADYYRRALQKFYETRAKRRDWDMREQMRALETKIAGSTRAEEKRSCSLGRCNGTGECWDGDGRVSACRCEIGRELSPRVLEAFEQMNAVRGIREPGGDCLGV